MVMMFGERLCSGRPRRLYLEIWGLALVRPIGVRWPVEMAAVEMAAYECGLAASEWLLVRPPRMHCRCRWRWRWRAGHCRLQLLLLFCDDDGVTSRPSVAGSVVRGASKLGPTCNTMLQLVARQVLERLICECIDSGSLDVDGDDDRAFKFRPFGRNLMAKLVWQLLERQLYRRRGSGGL
ncbi:GL21428 [Drosophila persimilis]|uniref:GL21428 n=1 Tax=Drosophila persimilis TaxID=7234 RepID=B4IQS8_DROPE|nr:GL21428 [Drosophila persimilis]